MNEADTERERLAAILDFWHKIEFFIPFDLSGYAEPGQGKSFFRMHRESLDEGETGFRRPHIPADKELKGFRVFFGVFDKAEIADVVRFATRPVDDMAACEEAERSDLEGDTCFASLDLDAEGRPFFGTFSVSTLPWAMGRVRREGLAALTSGAFAASRLNLAERLRNFEAQRQLDQPTSGDGIAALTVEEIAGLADMLCAWAEFAPPPERPIALVEIRFRPKPVKSDRPALPPPEIREGEADGEEIGILNSFFIEDIERALAAVPAGSVPEALRQYLTLLPAGDRLDLYTDEGRRALIAALHPRHLNHGRWPGEPHHAMSLMQQFAINTAVGSDAEELLSVNGPPGTGKTTLLRDIIAENVVKRARVFAGLKNARDAFAVTARPFTLSDGSQAYVAHLRPELLGYEMVVASSNNAAVENISRDLPKRESLGKACSLEYLQPVAHMVAALDDRGGFAALNDKDRPWGLVACALGKSRNRDAFKQRFYFGEIKEEAEGTWSGDVRPRNIRTWLADYEGPSFAEAAVAFRDADAAVVASLVRYRRYADLHETVGLGSETDFCRKEQADVNAAVEERQTLSQAQAMARTEKGELETRREALREEERLIDRSQPTWWQRLLPTRAGRDHRQRMAENAREHSTVNAALAETERRLKTLKTTEEQIAARHTRSVAALRTRREDWARMQAECEELAAALGHPPIPAQPEDIEADAFQITGLWHSDALARQRSALFEAALGLHEAWLAETGGKGGGFGGNIAAVAKLLSGKIPLDPTIIPVLWQSLFLIVPLVSTTFASFARQFHGMGPGSIGWLFVDEAGQAVPQAAVGALFRARRALVIGDPLQIEPVFTLPSALIEALAILSPHTRDGDHAPNRVSAQTLADAANRFGTAVSGQGDEELWVGSPLRVHRRCFDPMFSLANRIAYQDKMVYGLPERLPAGDGQPFYGDSAWIDIRGVVDGRQTVRAQVRFIADMLAATVRRYGVLPEIYIISPFKEIKEALKQEIRKIPWCDARGAPIRAPEGLGDFLKKRIGTVHTFQGKEERAVFMVLGADAAHAGAVAWASSKPNLLNVAATRAQHRFYIVGDRDLWRGRPYFSEAARMLPPLSGEAFLARIAPPRP